MSEEWLRNLKSAVEKAPVVVIQFESEEWSDLLESRRGAREFSIVRPHGILERCRLPAACLVFGKDDSRSYARFGVVTSRAAVSTLESRIKIKRARAIQPDSKDDLLRSVLIKRFKRMLHTRINSDKFMVVLSPKMSSYLIEILSHIEANRTHMQAASFLLSSPKTFRSTASLQEDAVQTALRAFGLSKHSRAADLELFKGRETALARLDMVEDSVIEHDARSVPGYRLVQSDITGRARFERGFERLEIYTANRRRLERVFGVDLIYLNLTRKNIVMVQYKMLDRTNAKESRSDWIYRPDNRLKSQMMRMQVFSKTHPLEDYEYRLNPQIFYLKFVKRGTGSRSAAIIMPIDHYKRLSSDPTSIGPRGGFRISFDGLGGRYLRQEVFLNLIRSGYIGSPSTTTDNLAALMRASVEGDMAVVAAIQSSMDEAMPID